MAMLRSRGVVLLLSVDALKRMQATTADSRVDNVLMEWSLALELFAAKRISFILPLKRGTIETDTSNVTSILSFSKMDPNPLTTLPAVVPPHVVGKVRDFLLENGITPSEQLATRTVSDIVKLLAMDFFFLDAGRELNTLRKGASPGSLAGIGLIGLHKQIANQIMTECILKNVAHAEVSVEAPFALVPVMPNPYPSCTQKLCNPCLLCHFTHAPLPTLDCRKSLLAPIGSSPYLQLPWTRSSCRCV